MAGTTAVRTRVALVRASAGRYRRVLGELTRDALAQYRRQTVLILAAGAVSLVLQVNALVAALLYANLLERGETLSAFGRDYPVRSSVTVLVVFTAAAVVLLLAASVLMYYSRSRLLRLRRDYEVFCAERALKQSNATLRAWSTEAVGVSSDQMLLRLARADARFCGRVLAYAVDSVIPLVTLVLALGALLYIQPLATLLVILVIAASAPLFVRASRAGAGASRTYEETRGAAGREYRQAVSWVTQSPFPAPEGDSWLSRGVFEAEPVQRFFDAYERRLRVVEEARLFSTSVFAVALLIILLAFGSRIIQTGEGWAQLLVYLVALRRGMTSFQQLNQRLSTINRFYPQVKRYFEFVRQTGAPAAEGRPVPDRYAIVCPEPVLAGSAVSHEVTAGSRVGVLAPFAVDRHTVAALITSLLDAEGDAAVALDNLVFVTASYGYLAGRPLRETLGVPADADQAQVDDDLAELGFTEPLPELSMLDETMTAERWEAVPRSSRLAFALLHARRAGTQWVVVPDSSLQLVDERRQQAVLRSMGDRIMVVAYTADAPLPAHNEDIVAVIDGASTLGLGDAAWFQSVRDEALDAMQQSSTGALFLDAAADSLDDLEEDD